MAALALALLFLLGVSSTLPATSAQQSAFSDTAVNELLEDLRNRGFYTGATIVSLFVAKTNLLAPGTTLLIPRDQSLAKGPVAINPNFFEALIKFHILNSDFNFTELRLLPVGSWIPTTLQGYDVEVTSNSASNFSLDNVQIIDNDICPRMARLRVTCQGVSALLNSTSTPEPSNPRFGAPLPFAPTASPIATPLPPAPSTPPPSPLAAAPAPSATVPPFEMPPVPSPSPSVVPTASPSPTPSPSPSPFVPFFTNEPIPDAVSPPPMPPSVPIFPGPLPTAVSPASPIQAPPAVSTGDSKPTTPEKSSGTLSTVASQTNMLALATALGSIILVML